MKACREARTGTLPTPPPYLAARHPSAKGGPCCHPPRSSHGEYREQLPLLTRYSNSCPPTRPTCAETWFSHSQHTVSARAEFSLPRQRTVEDIIRVDAAPTLHVRPAVRFWPSQTTRQPSPACPFPRGQVGDCAMLNAVAATPASHLMYFVRGRGAYSDN